MDIMDDRANNMRHGANINTSLNSNSMTMHGTRTITARKQPIIATHDSISSNKHGSIRYTVNPGVAPGPPPSSGGPPAARTKGWLLRPLLLRCGADG